MPIHVSTEFLCVAGLVASGITAIITSGFVSLRRDRRRAEQVVEDQRYRELHFGGRGVTTGVSGTTRSNPAASGAAPAAPACAPAMMAPSVIHSGGPGDLLTGMLIGNVMAGGHHHTTEVIHDHTPAATPSYSPPSSPASDPGGFSWSDSGSSYSGGGFDSGGSSSGGGDSGS